MKHTCPHCGSFLHIQESLSCGEAPGKRQRWRKILYEEQPLYPENYVDRDTFLQKLVKNANQREYNIRAVMRDSTGITMQITLVALFTVVFSYLLAGTISSTALIIMEALLALTGVGIRLLIDANFRRNKRKPLQSLRSVAILLLVLFGLSPVLQTLVSSFSDDTIWALSISFFLLHVLLHDYSYTNASTKRMDAPVSLNAAIFASVLLASRLESSDDVFALIFLAVEMFALSPLFRHVVQSYSMGGSLALAVVMVTTATVLLAYLSLTVTVVYLAAICFITVLCPLWLMAIQKYKNEITGPWDEAVPKI